MDIDTYIKNHIHMDKEVPILYGLPITLMVLGFFGDIVSTWAATNIHGMIEYNSALLIEYGFSLWSIIYVLYFIFVFIVYDRLYKISPVYSIAITIIPTIITWNAFIHNMMLIWRH